MGFVFRKVVSESDAVASIDEATQSGSCLLDVGDETNKDDSKMLADVKWLAPKDVSTWSNGWDHKHVIQTDEGGMYQLIFERCYPADADTTVSFDINVTMYNVNALTGKKDYLSAGDSALPLIYFISTATFGVMGMFWLYVCHKSREFVHHVHVLMLILIGLKMMASLFRGISYYSLQLYGHSVGWNVIFYIFTFLRGTMLFSVIMLVGTGWSLLKPYLNEREKRILLTVLPLQVIDNIALVAIEEMSPGSRAWLTWRDALHIVDIICCCLILFPLVWQIRRLRVSAVADGKSLFDLDKLTRYRNFYMAVVGYIYFTRIIVYLLGATVPFNLSWLKSFSDEAATVFFFCWTGWKFRPMCDNPYLPVQLDDDDDFGDDDLDEYGLDDDLDQFEGGTRQILGSDANAQSSQGGGEKGKEGIEMASKRTRSNTTLRMMSENPDGWEDEMPERFTPTSASL
jgi:hypothetical protein